MEALEGVEEEGFRTFAVVPVRGEDARGEEGLRQDRPIAARLRVVEGLVERAAGLVPAAEFHERVPAPHEGDRPHRPAFWVCGPTEGGEEVRVDVDRVLPSLIVLAFVGLVEGFREGGAIDARHPFGLCDRWAWPFPSGYRDRARRPIASRIRSISAGPIPGWTGSSKSRGMRSC